MRALEDLDAEKKKRLKEELSKEEQVPGLWWPESKTQLLKLVLRRG